MRTLGKHLLADEWTSYLRYFQTDVTMREPESPLKTTTTMSFHCMRQGWGGEGICQHREHLLLDQLFLTLPHPHGVGTGVSSPWKA